MATVHSTISNRAGAKVEVRQDGKKFTWTCNGCKRTNDTPQSLSTVQDMATTHASRCHFN